MATRSKYAREHVPVQTTVAYRGDELDELIAASSEVVAVMSQTELLESQPTVAQLVTELDDADYEVLDPESDTAEAEAEADAFEPMPESVPIVESTVVLASTDALRHELSQGSARLNTLDSQRPVAYDIPCDEAPSCPSTTSMVPPIAYTLGDSDGIETVVGRSAARAPALITLTIAVVAITVGVLLGSTFSAALSHPPRAATATNAPAASAANAVPAATEGTSAPPPRHAEPRTSVDEKVSLADAGVREKAVKPSKPIGATVRRQTGAQTGSQATFEAELRSKMEKADKASSGTVDALGEAQLNRPF